METVEFETKQFLITIVLNNTVLPLCFFREVSQSPHCIPLMLELSTTNVVEEGIKTQFTILL